MLELIAELWKYIKMNPLEIPAFVISLMAFVYTRKKIKSGYAKINLETFYGSSETYSQLKIYSPEKGQSLLIKEIPTIYKRKFGVYKKLNYLIDYSHQLDNKTHEAVHDIYYIHIDRLSKLEKGKYMIIVKIDLLPNVLRYKFTLPLVTPLQNSEQLIG